MTGFVVKAQPWCVSVLLIQNVVLLSATPVKIVWLFDDVWMVAAVRAVSTQAEVGGVLASD